MAATRVPFPTPREWALDLAIATGIGVFMGVIGPFGSFNGGPIELRVFYWVANLWIGFVILQLVVRLTLRQALRHDLPVWFALPAGVAVGALPLSLIVAAFSVLAWPGTHGRVGNPVVWYGQTLAIAEPCALLYYLLGRRAGRFAPPPSADVAPAAQTPVAAAASPQTGEVWLRRIAPHLGPELLCLQMEDHYVRVHTARGSDLVLMPLKSAVAELETEGLQVHRSWWVARSAVAEPVWAGRNLRLRLKTGLEVPVSRAQVAELRAKGWLDVGSTP